MAVRLKLADLLTSLHTADSTNTWTSLTQRKGKKRTEPHNVESVSVGRALLHMVNDSDHQVRMHVAGAVTTLFHTTASSSTHTRPANQLSESRSHDGMVLLSRAGQEETFKQIMDMLQLAFVIADGLDELSMEDESVNRVASRIYTLLLVGGVSPVCEGKVIEKLVMAVGDSIEADLVTKVCRMEEMVCVCSGEQVG